MYFQSSAYDTEYRDAFSSRSYGARHDRVKAEVSLAIAYSGCWPQPSGLAMKARLQTAETKCQCGGTTVRSTTTASRNRSLGVAPCTSSSMLHRVALLAPTP